MEAQGFGVSAIRTSGIVLTPITSVRFETLISRDFCCIHSSEVHIEVPIAELVASTDSSQNDMGRVVSTREHRHWFDAKLLSSN